MGNLNQKIERCCKKPSGLLWSLILIFKSDNIDVWLDINHIYLKIMTK